METRIRRYTPDDRPWLVEAHGTFYAREAGFDATFGPLVDGILRGFEADHDPARERGWIAMAPDGRLGSIFCVAAGDGRAKLRLFLLLPEARGLGLGRALLATCMGFAEEVGYPGMVLWTHAEHRAACALYQRNGGTCRSSTPVHSFGVALTEQSWEIAFDAP